MTARAEEVSSGAEIRVKPVTGRRELSRFITLPRQLYSGRGGFLPPLDLERRHALHPDHAALFERAEIQYWIAWRNGEAVGRISAQIDPVTLRAWNEQVGMFGCLDAIDDREVVAALVKDAAEWLKARGMTGMRGPFSLSINGEAGLLVEGQDSPAMIMSPWHPAYLASHAEAAGLTPVKDLLAYRLVLSERDYETKTGITRRLAGQVSMRGINFHQFEKDAETMRQVFNDSWKNNWGFVPLTAEEFAKLAKELRPLLYDDCAVFVEKDQETVAFALLVPNIYDLTRGFDGRLWPFNWIRFGWRIFRKSFRSARILLMGVRSDLQFTAFGAMLPVLMIEELGRRGRDYSVEEVEMGWILDDNARVRTLIEAYGGALNKRFRLFECRI